MNFYRKHKCALLIPLLLLIVIDVIAFEHITDDIAMIAISTTMELWIFIVSLSLTYYYIYKHHQNIRAYYCYLKRLFKGGKNECE